MNAITRHRPPELHTGLNGRWRLWRTAQRRAPGGRAARLAALALIGALSACGPLPETGFSFAAPSTGFGQTSPQGAARGQTNTQVRLAKGAVTLVAPRGHCIDQATLRQDPDGGFALLPRCNLLQGPSLFGRHRAAVITATLGKTSQSAPPSTAELARSAAGAQMLSYNDKGLLPLIKLRWPGHGAMGVSAASADHWRGAFVIGDQLVVLALYAPEGSPLLGRNGADLLTEMARRSLAASQAGPATAAPGATAPAAAPQTASGLRPRARPTAAASPAAQEPPQKHRQQQSMRQKIAGLFHPAAPARLTVD